ncbi:ATP-binding protein, partial [Aspergillus stella-maris]|uniref:ATP-binding protein n=1 Tax=Aspergillus stella-maris TaxID=1810926 RepID=UPI003CCD28B0
MAGNHADLRDALLDSSEYLADVLSRCAFLEERFYQNKDASTIDEEKEQSIIRVYIAILQYAARVRKAQQYNRGERFVDSITAVAIAELTDLKSSISKEEDHLQLWLLLDQHLHRQAEAEAILTRIDEMMVTVEEVAKAVAMLDLPLVDGAVFDSFVDQHEGECHPGTRGKLIEQVVDWGSSSDKCIFWLSVMAGTGKSTIARTVARHFKNQGLLGASFFFKRGEKDRGSAVKFFPTLARQLAVHIPQMLPGIQKSLGLEPSLPNALLRQQFKKLLLQPLLDAGGEQAVTPTVIVIDALDECDGEDDLEVIINLLPTLEKETSFAIRVFLSSRPETAIRFGFDQIDQSAYENTVLQNLDNNLIKRDISLYLREEFTQIKIKRQKLLPSDWPGEERIESLAVMARFNPQKRLQQFFTESSGSRIDKTYRPILNQLLVEDEDDTMQLIEEFQRIIGVIVLLATPLSLNALSQLLYVPAADIENSLDAFHSVLDIPSDPLQPVRTLHLSFHDYLLDNRTKTNTVTSKFWVNRSEKHGLLVEHCLNLMDNMLEKNICKLPSRGTMREEIDAASIARHIPEALQYACRYWVYHVTQNQPPGQSLKGVLPFLKKHFLHWLEVMSILGAVLEAANMIKVLIHLSKLDNTKYRLCLTVRHFTFFRTRIGLF